ncbi:NAD(P)H-dependent oxidoreductase [Nocardioides marmotae]|uniref:NAD(P)H-dependent oxidoreductase n=1 Tax=Nocardioides marmotae TaxID=2663857 RepID=UPI00132A59A5|nr:NAD(P)H-dependent oxidoreductase [Nocardioides marmotae]MBC9731996.1 NAD(P)H-dependent oxidoreductase [Nocardioides marmotae]MTB83117.1 flavodoxin family protein [Nocardioides marmotae]
MPRVLVIDAHPDDRSLCAALAERYAAGARAGGAEVELLALRDLEVDLNLRRGLHGDQPTEPDLVRARAALVAADHVAVITPVWWGSVPALLKGFLDRALERGWAYRYRDNGMPEGLLAGRSARVVVTTDSPGWWLRGLMGDSAVRQLTRSTLRFCGLRPVRATRIGQVHGSTAEQRAAWLDQVEDLGRADTRRTPRRGKLMPPLPAAEPEPVT